MFALNTTRNNGIAYLIWSWLMYSNGRFSAWLDGFYFGSSRGMNDYDVIATRYVATNIKPDKHYSILPTVMEMVGDCRGKVIFDFGCGSGFFTLQLAQAGAHKVCGIDNSVKQIELAKRFSKHPSVSYCVRDIFTQYCGCTDIITAPFVINYARSVPILTRFFELVFASLTQGGMVVFVFDLPNGKSLKRFGATKTFLGPVADETQIQINLFNEEKQICTLFAVYYTPRTIEFLLRNVGFREIQWYRPIISEEGIERLGHDFWKGYIDDPGLGYVVASK